MRKDQPARIYLVAFVCKNTRTHVFNIQSTREVNSSRGVVREVCTAHDDSRRVEEEREHKRPRAIVVVQTRVESGFNTTLQKRFIML